METKLLALGLVTVWVIVALAADVFFKQATSLHSWAFGVGASLYAFTSIIAFYTYQRAQWGWIGIVWCAMCTLLGLVMSVVLYSEPLTYKRVIGATLCVVALFLVE